MSDHKTLGDAIVERASSLAGDAKKALKTPMADFLEAHRALGKAQAKADEARAERDAALAAVATADEALDGKIEALADVLVGEGLGKRKNPFQDFSKHSPSDITRLAYAKEIEVTRALLARLAKAKKLPKTVGSFVKAVEKSVDGVEKALAGLVKPQNRAQKALAERDELLLDWHKQLSRLKKIATGALVDDPSTFRALFSTSPVDVLAGKSKKTKRAKKKPADKTATPPA